MAEEKETFHLEEAFKELESMINKLESQDTSLKDSIELYSQGAKLLGKCREELTGIEKEMIVISESMESDEE